MADILGPNLFPNPSFETGDLTGWINLESQVSSEEARTGIYSLKLGVAGGSIFGGVSNVILVDADEDYYLEFHNKVTDIVSGIYAILILEYSDVIGSILNEINATVLYITNTVTDDWIPTKLTFSGLPDTKSIRLQQQHSPGPGAILTGYLDDILFQRIYQSQTISQREEVTGDIKLIFDPLTLETDLSVVNNDLVAEEGLETAVIISLFSDRRARDDDILPDIRSDDKRGWWGDLVAPDVEGDEIGSRLWLLDRAKTTQQNVNKCKAFVKESLQWMIDDGVAVKIDTFAERQGTPPNDILAFGADIFKSDGTNETFKFDSNWVAQFS
jgi:phage gp46-like protein